MPYAGVAVLKGDNNLKGIIHFKQETEQSPVLIKGEICGLTAGHHGFHIHQFGDVTNGCISAGPHFNVDPGNHHGGPTSNKRHNGDLGNVVCGSDGVAKVDISDSKISLVPGSDTYIIGRSLVLHALQDDLGLGGNEESLKTGNAGGRIACGIVGLAKVDS